MTYHLVRSVRPIVRDHCATSMQTSRRFGGEAIAFAACQCQRTYLFLQTAATNIT